MTDQAKLRHPDWVSAMIAIQCDMKNPLKSNPNSKFPSVSLDELLDMIRPIAAAHGMCILQSIDDSNEGQDLLLRTELIHASGHKREFFQPIRRGLAENGTIPAQILGASMTYARKYALFALFACHGDPDGDGDKPVNRAPPQLPPHAKPVTPAKAPPKAPVNPTTTGNVPTKPPGAIFDMDGRIVGVHGRDPTVVEQDFLMDLEKFPEHDVIAYMAKKHGEQFLRYMQAKMEKDSLTRDQLHVMLKECALRTYRSFNIWKSNQ